MKVLKRVSRCRTVITHLFVSWVLTNLALVFVLYMTASCFDHTEWESIAAMVMFTGGLKIMQYDLWKIRHDKYKADRLVER
jgi:hypothetical protein